MRETPGFRGGREDEKTKSSRNESRKERVKPVSIGNS